MRAKIRGYQWLSYAGGLYLLAGWSGEVGQVGAAKMGGGSRVGKDGTVKQRFAAFCASPLRFYSIYKMFLYYLLIFYIIYSRSILPSIPMYLSSLCSPLSSINECANPQQIDFSFH